MSSPTPNAPPSGRPERPAPREHRDIPVRAPDLPFFYILLALQGALLVTLPVGAWILAPLVRRMVSLGQLPAAAPPLFLLLLALMEAVFLMRARRIWRRLRSSTRRH